jgi:hypothetical protein
MAAGKSFLALTFILFILNSIAIGQTITLKGVIKDIQGQPISNASISLKNAKAGTSSDSSGSFSIIAKPGSIIIISAIGFADTSVSIGDKHEISIVLRQKAKTLNAVVVNSTQNQTPTGSNEISTVQIIQNTLEDYVKSEQMGAGIKSYSGNTEGRGTYHLVTTQNMGTVNYGGLLPVYHQPMETRGTRYLIAHWSQGLVVNQFDTIINNNSYLYNYDKITGDLLLTQDMSNYISVEQGQVKSFAIKSDEGGYIFEHVSLINSNGYFQLLNKGDKYAAYKSIKTKLVKANGISNGLTQVGNDYDEYVDDIVYYFIDFKSKTAKQFDLKKKSIKDVMAVDKTRVDKYFTDHKDESINDNFLKGLIAYLNS